MQRVIFSEAEEYLRDQAQALISSWHCVLHKQMMLPVKELKKQKPIFTAISDSGGNFAYRRSKRYN